MHRRVDAAHEEAWVTGRVDPQQDAPGIESKAEGSATAFSDLGSRNCEVGMSSRPIKPTEAEALAQKGLGDLTTPAAEHVIGLDGITVIVHPNSPLRSIELEQLKRVFDGKLADLSSIGGPPGGVHLFARDDRSGTYDTFKHAVLGDDSLSLQAKRLVDSGALSDAVTSDPQAIGFIGLAYVRGAKAVAVAEAGAPPLYASAFTVGTEDYCAVAPLVLHCRCRALALPRWIS